MSTRYQLYEANTVKLVESLVIKSTDTVDALNQWVIDYYGADKVNKNDPHSWKYYLNVSGEYHFTDSVMSVVSWDTLETIVFNKENLAVHRATFKAYSYGSTQYADLVNKFPNQELLIRGILNPTDIDVAINAENGSVLAYNTDLVEENEYSLVDKIDQWIKSFKVRYVNEQFNISDELYAATHHGIMYLNLVPAILNFRLGACKTNEAHSYHITEYLLSHGVPEYSIMHMTKKQMLFFYRNIKYIQRNAGSVDTFVWILDHIMTERFLPMSEYVMRHDWEKQLDNLMPEVSFRNIKLNDVYGAPNQDNLTTSEILSKENNNALGNYLYSQDEGANIEQALGYSKSSTVMTKMLESAIIDYTESGQNSPAEVLLQHWLYFSVIGKYKSYIGVVNPKTNERIPLSAKDAFTLMIYAWAKSMGVDLIEVPKVLAKRVMRLPQPTVDQLMELVDQKRISKSVATELRNYMPIVGDIVSTEAFNTVGMKIYKALMAQLKRPALEEHYYDRGLVQNMAMGLYCDKLCQLEPDGTLYSEWFNDRVLDFSDFSRSEFADLAEQITSDVTGIELEEEPNLQSLQAAMIRLFEYLSSYSIQFVKRINNNGLISTNNTSVRLGDVLGQASGLIEFYDVGADVLNYGQVTKYNIHSDVIDDSNPNTVADIQEIISVKSTFKASIDMDVDVNPQPEMLRMNYQIDVAPVSINSVEVRVL